MKISDEDQENRNLVNLINKDLREDESSDDDIIFENKNIHLDLDKVHNEVHSADSLQTDEPLENKNTEDTMSGLQHQETNERSSVSSNIISDPSESENSSIKDKGTQGNSNKVASDDTLSDVTDVSEKLEDDLEENYLNGAETVVPHTDDLKKKDSSSDESSSSTHSENSAGKKLTKLSAKLGKVKLKLEEELRTNQRLYTQLRDEKDAKERLETNLAELQRKYDRQLREEEELRHQLHKKDELNSILERKELGLMQEVVEVKRKLSENLDHQHLSACANDNSYSPDTHQTVNEKLIIDINELQCKLETSEHLLADKDSHIESLGRELILLKEKLSELQSDEEEVQPEMECTETTSIPDDLLQEKIKTMVESVIGDSHKRVKIKDLEEEVKKLNVQLDENKDKYTANLAEALSTLKQVQDAYGEMRDVVLEGYKQEISVLNDRVRIAEEKSNEDIITGLRQELLDTRLQQERTKQGHKDEMETQQKKYDECEVKGKDLCTEVENLKIELEAKEDMNKTIYDSLQKAQILAEERKEKIEELNDQLKYIDVLKETISEKEELISELKSQLLKEAEVLTKEHAEKEALQLEVELMESVKRQNQRLEEEIEEMGHKVKLRGTKIKFLKKHIKELEEQKQKAESLMLVIPEMQKKIDELTGEKEKLRQDIMDREKQEEDMKRKLEEEKKEEEERLQKEKEDWEKRILGIGKCSEYHEEEKEPNYTDGGFHRPSSAPLLKPRPPTAKRHQSKNVGKQNGFRAPTLNPAFLNSYPEGRKATQKMKHHQEKIILSTQTRDNLFRSVTKPMSYSNASYKHISEGKYFPKISPRNKDNPSAPRVLVWGSGDGPGSKMVAVGDVVLINRKSDCSVHGQSSKQHHGIVKFIGFVDGNDDDVYIGLRLEEEVGYTDGVIQGKRYFRSEPEKGVFVHLDDIVEIVQSQTKHVPTLTI